MKSFRLNALSTQSSIALVAVLTAFGSLAIAQNVDSASPHSISYPGGETLAQCVGKRTTVKGVFTKIENGRVGIIVRGKPDTHVSIDPLPCPTLGELPFNFVVDEHGQTTKKPKYRRKGQQTWIGNDARQKKLEQLLEQYELASSVEVTGKLCHMTARITGNVQKNIGYPRIPDSHYFFSVDDVTLVATNPHPKK
jgi:hypothetical protein